MQLALRNIAGYSNRLIKVKSLSLCFTHNLKACEGVEVKPRVFLTSALDRGEWSLTFTRRLLYAGAE
jgi:hypothetical protein